MKTDRLESSQKSWRLPLPSTARKPIIDIRAGSFMRGPITVRDSRGRMVLDLPPGVTISS